MRLDQHTRQARIYRHTCHSATRIREFAVVDGLQLFQQTNGIAHRPGIRRVNETKPADIAESKRLHLQHHRCQVDPMDFSIGELGARQKVLLAVQAITHPGSYTAATAFALICTGLGYRLHRQTLQLRSIAVAVDPCKAWVDDIADIRNGQ